MPILLYRYILGELLRVFILTTAVLVTVIAFGATVKPLTDDGLFTVADTIKYMFMAMVPMLQFALPFSAGFATTMVFHRLASDNEIVAAAAGGISYRRILMPIAVFGLALTLLMVGLTQSAIPRLWTLMERTVTADVTKLFQASIQRGTPFQLGNLQIYADDMRVVVNPRDTDAETRLILRRVAAAEIDSDGRITTDVTANHSVVDIHRIGDQSYLKLVMQETVGFDGKTGQLAYLPEVMPRQAIPVPSILRDQLRAMTRGQLLELREHPDRYSRIAQAKASLARHVRDKRIWETLDARLEQDREVELIRSGPEPRTYTIHADGIVDGRFTRESGPVEVIQRRAGEPIRTVSAETVRLLRPRDSTLGEGSFDLEMIECLVRDLRAGGSANRRERLIDHHLRIAGLDEDTLPEMPVHDLLAHVRAQGDPVLEEQAMGVEKRIAALNREIRSRITMRYAQSTTAVLLALLGAVLAMWLRGTLPLAVYIWSFAPSVITLIMISGGDKMMRDGAIIGGLSVMWAGNAAMLFMLLITFVKLSRN